MVLECGTCGSKVKDTTARFCSHCGAKIGDKGKSSATGVGAGRLIAPVGETEGASALPVMYCAAHPRRKVDGFCQQCQELVCVTCLTQKPRQHDGCDEPLGLEDLLAMKDPFKDQRKQLSDGRKAGEKLLQDLKTRKADTKTRSKAEVSKLNGMKMDAVELLDEKFEAEVNKLRADRDQQKALIDKTTKTKISHIEKSEDKVIDELQNMINAIVENLQKLETADQKLASSFSANTLLDHVAGNKEARQLLTTSDTAPAPAPLPAATGHDQTELHRLADLTVEVTAKKLAGAPQKDLTLAATTKKPKTAVPKAKGRDEARTRPDAVFAVGSRVVPGPDWPSSYKADGGGPGTITDVRGDGTCDVRWDAGLRGSYYSIGYQGKYHLKVVKPS